MSELFVVSGAVDGRAAAERAFDARLFEVFNTVRRLLEERGALVAQFFTVGDALDGGAWLSDDDARAVVKHMQEALQEQGDAFVFAHAFEDALAVVEGGVAHVA